VYQVSIKIQMKSIITILLALYSSSSFAQKSANITLSVSQPEQMVATLILEDVQFRPNLGIGLAESIMETISMAQFSETLKEKTEVLLDGPRMMRLRYNGGAINKTYMLFIQPGDDLTVRFGSDGSVVYEGKNANYQQFLVNHFLENHYQYLPVFGYKPAQFDRNSVIRQSDSLFALRVSAFQDFKKNNTTSQAFESYVVATTETEPSLIRQLMQERIMRKNKVSKLTPEQRKELEDFTLSDFKILDDFALLSKSYRDELRNWALIPSTRKFPLDEKRRYEISPEALMDVYSFSKEKLKDKPRQLEYLLTYWVNYALTAIPSVEAGRDMLADYRQIFPNSAHTQYFSGILSAKLALVQGGSLPNFTMLDKDSVSSTFDDLKGKPSVLVFAYSMGQHEPALKIFEQKYADKINFVYLSVNPGVPFEGWRKYVGSRPGIRHGWITEESLDVLKKDYAVDVRYPFLVVDAAGKVVERWIPQEFPNNLSLENEIKKAIQRQ
jgi:hypothetical protein